MNGGTRSGGDVGVSGRGGDEIGAADAIQWSEPGGDAEIGGGRGGAVRVGGRGGDVVAQPARRRRRWVERKSCRLCERKMGRDESSIV
ncbi:unnamed protein product, partial [Linum tenue]